MTESPASGFAAVPNWIIRDPGISRGAVQVYMALASRSGPGGIFPSQGTLAGELECSERSIRRWLSELEDRGLIERVPRRSNGRGMASKLPDGYVLHPNGKFDYREAATDGRLGGGYRPEEAGATGHSLQSTPLIEEEPVEEEPVRAYPFDDFYAVYPRKVGKVEARRAFAKAARSTDPMVIVAGARRFAADPNLPPKQFIPNPSTWLNRGSWDDEPLPERDDAPAAAGTGDWMNQ